MTADGAAPTLHDISTGMAMSLMQEIAERLGILAEGGEPHAIDLLGIPMSKRDRDELEAMLGRGEVEVTLDVAGASRLWETQYSGVWWIRHFGEGERVASERIEIVSVPEILSAHRLDMAAAAQRLSDELAEANDLTPQEESTHV